MLSAQNDQSINPCSARQYWAHVAQPRMALIKASASTDQGVLQTIDDEVAALRILITSMHRQRNSFARVSRLPPEILSRIFSFLAVINAPTGYGVSSRSVDQKLGWIRVSHVCSHWREVALEDPTLWRCIPFFLGSHWVTETLVRAKGAPLIIDFMNHLLHQETAQSFTSSILPHLSHVQCLKLSGSEMHFLRAIQSLTLPAPIIDCIDLRSSAEDIVLHLPPDLFARHAPRLRTALFDDVKATWSSPILRNLTTLSVSLSQRKVSPSNLPSPSEFFEAMSNMPHLEHLTIRHSLPRPPTAISHGYSHTVTLHRLMSLTLEDTWFTSMAALQIIRFPSTADLDLGLTLTQNTRETNNILPRILQRRTSPLRVIFIESDAYNTNTNHKISGWSDTEGSRGLYVDPSSKKPIQLRVSKANQSTLREIASIMQSICLQDLTTLSINIKGTNIWDINTFCEVFTQAHGLKYVRLYDFATVLFCVLLARDSHPKQVRNEADVQRSEGALFPNLQYMMMMQVSFSLVYDLDDTPFLPLRELLPRTLQERKALGVPLQSLDIRTHNPMSRKLLDELKEIVPIAHWWSL